MAIQLGQLEVEFKKTVEHFKKELARVRTGRASPALLEGIYVDYYGASTALNKLGMVNAPEPRMLTIQVYDSSACEAIEKAIQQSELGLSPNREGNLIRLPIPALNEERRKDLIKKTHKMAEESKIVLRNQRRDTLDGLKKKEKAKEISGDEIRKAEAEIQKILDKYNKEIDSILAVKEKEVMEV